MDCLQDLEPKQHGKTPNEIIFKGDDATKIRQNLIEFLKRADLKGWEVEAYTQIAAALNYPIIRMIKEESLKDKTKNEDLKNNNG